MVGKETVMGLLQRSSTGTGRRTWVAPRAVRASSPWSALGISLALLAAACGASQTQVSSSAPSAGNAAVAPSIMVPATPLVTAASSDMASSAPSAAAASAAPTPAPSGMIAVRGTSQTFTSRRYGYSLTVTTDWAINEAPGSWNGLISRNSYNPDPGTDDFSDPGVATIEVGFQAVPPGTTVAAWEASEASSVQNGIAVLGGERMCPEAAATQTVRVAGREVLLLPEPCPSVGATQASNASSRSFINAFLVDGTSGVVLQWYSANGGEAAARAAFLPVLGTLTFGTSS